MRFQGLTSFTLSNLSRRVSNCQSTTIFSRSMSTNPMTEGLVPGRTRIGWIGTGVMGQSMCAHLIKQANPPYQFTVYNRTASKCAGLAELGAHVASSPEEVAARSDIVFTIVGFPADVRSVILGSGDAKSGVLNHLAPGAIIVDMTTSEPSLAAEISTAAKAKGVESIDAPVSGGDIGARNATLSIMIGGEVAAINAVRPLFEAMGKNICHMGPAGSGQHTKMVNQILICTNMIGMCEGLVYAQRAGLDLTATINAISAGAAGSWSLNNLAPRIVNGNFEPGFFVEHFVKDLNIALAECRRMNLSLPGLSLATSLYTALMAQGYEKKGTQALILALEALNGIKRS